MPGACAIPISDAPLPMPAIVGKEPAKPRRMYIRKALIERYGYTPGCRGCKAVLAGNPTATAKNHTEACRKRIQEAVERDDKRERDEDVIMDESVRKRSKLDDKGERLQRKRQSDTDHRDLDVERSQRDEGAAQAGTKSLAEDPPDDSERGERLGVLDEAGGRPP